jgi:hypothetical protein
MNEFISKDVLDDIRKSDRRVVSNNSSGTGSTLISYISALRVKNDAKLFFESHGNIQVFSYPYSKFANQGDSVGDNIKDEFIVDKILDDDIIISNDKFIIFEGDQYSDHPARLQFFYQWGRVDEKKLVQWGLPPKEIEFTKSLANRPSLDDFISCAKKLEKRLKPDFLQKVEKYSSFFTDKTISVHIRTGNNMDWTQSKFEMKKYKNMTENIVLDYYKQMDDVDSTFNFFVCCDNDEILTRFKDRYKNRVFTFDGEVDTSSRALLDIFLLSKNKRMILFHSSCFGELAWILAGAPTSVKIVSTERFTNPFWEHEEEEQESLLECGCMSDNHYIHCKYHTWNR